MKVTPYVMFKGNCKDAIAFYKDALAAEVRELKTFGDMPDSPLSPMPEERKPLISYALLNFGGGSLIVSDCYPGSPYKIGNNFNLSIEMDDADTLRSTFAALSRGGDVPMELQETFFNPLYGVAVDQFGITWTFSMSE